LLLNVTGWGLEGWQWLFILEALPSILVGLGVLFYLTDFPRQARWLQKDEMLGWRPCKQPRKGTRRRSNIFPCFRPSRIAEHIGFAAAVQFCSDQVEKTGYDFWRR
jgi:hypothetical protein